MIRLPCAAVGMLLFVVVAVSMLLAQRPVPSSWDKPDKLFKLQDDKINESSGLTLATQTKAARWLWTHNDGNHAAELFLINDSGETLSRLELSDLHVTDSEDLSSFDWQGTRYLLLADTGDNDLARKTLQFIVIKQPNLDRERFKKKLKLDDDSDAWTVTFQFEDGPRNCEAIAVDVQQQVVLLINKERHSACSVYQLPLADVLNRDSKLLTAKKLTELKLPTILGMAIRPDGGQLVALGREQLFVFDRQQDSQSKGWEPWLNAFQRGPATVNKPEQKQAEAVTYDTDGRSLLLSSEGVNEPIWRIPAK
jgi:hypothetical protein